MRYVKRRKSIVTSIFFLTYTPLYKLKIYKMAAHNSIRIYLVNVFEKIF